jgi:D-alanyl-D-alanine-carboxypeptidase/D-alanyl-D-alanine-endopeptidase
MTHQSGLNRRTALAAAPTLVLAGRAAAQAASADLTDETLRGVLRDRIDVQRMGVGIGMALVSAGGPRFIVYGRQDSQPDRPIDADTVFEIGSITKLFTALLLSEAVRGGELSLDDPADRSLPPDLRLPSRGGRQITLFDLATHTSGLPKLPANYPPLSDLAGQARYSQVDLAAALAAQALPRDPGAGYEYSNLGYGLLALALAHRAGLSYGDLVARRITGPLGMTSTMLAPGRKFAPRRAQGHDGELAKASSMPGGVLDGAGALKSTPRDLARFVAAALALSPTPLAPAFALMTASRRPSGSPSVALALGWQVVTQGGQTTVLKGGDTYGFTATVALNPEGRRRAAVERLHRSAGHRVARALPSLSAGAVPRGDRAAFDHARPVCGPVRRRAGSGGRRQPGKRRSEDPPAGGAGSQAAS